MPAGTLRSALEDFSGGQAHEAGQSATELGSSVAACPLPSGLGRHIKAASFLEATSKELAACAQQSHDLRRATAFTTRGASEVDAELDRQEARDKEMLESIESKVDQRLDLMADNTQKKLDQFFKTMRESYGVSFDGAMAPARSKGAASGSSAGHASQPWEGAKVKLKLPDLPPGKHATIQLEHQQPIPTGSGQAGTQQEAMASLLKRLDTLMRKVAGQPGGEETEKVVEEEFSGESAHVEPGSLGDLYHKVKMISGNLNGVYKHDHHLSEEETPEVDLLQRDDVDAVGNAPLDAEEEDVVDTGPPIKEETGRCTVM